VNTILTRYSTTLLPLFVAVAGVFTTAADTSAGVLFTWATLSQAVLLVLSTGTDYWLPLVDSRWRGAAKTGASLGFVALSAAVVAWSATDGHVSKANIMLLGVAVVKALVTEVATWIRTDAAAVIDAGSTADEGTPSITTVPPVATVVPLESLPEGSNLVAGDGLGGVTIANADEAAAARSELDEQSTPEHRES
jgi:hypothetical protein